MKRNLMTMTYIVGKVILQSKSVGASGEGLMMSTIISFKKHGL